jgi:glucokinase
MGHTPLLLGFDVGGTKSSVIVGTPAGEVLARNEFPSRSERGPDEMIGDLLTAARELRRLHPAVSAAGVSIGGPINVAKGLILSPPNLPGWNNLPLRDRLAEQLQLPVKIEHDAAACAKAEALWGAGRGHSRVCYLTCGTGFGMGLVVDGRPMYGSDGSSPEIGHVRYRDDGPEAFGKVGSYEAYCAGSSLGKLAVWAFPSRWTTMPTGAELSQLANAGDVDAIAVIHLNARAVGSACALLADVVCPDVILLGSMARHLGNLWISPVLAEYKKEIGDAHRVCKIMPAELGPRLQDCSALAAAVST